MILKTPTTKSITAGGTSQEASPHNKARRYILLQNTGAEDLWVSFDKAAVAGAPSILLEPGDALHFPAGTAPGNSIHVLGASLGNEYTLWEG